MSIPAKDLKLLWGKSAGRCSITRKELAEEASDAVPSRNLLLGEICHIVAENEDGPRGKSVLTPEERNRYPNLILLCHAEHERIDQDPTAWPIEKLHQIRADHELWVEEALTEAKDHEDEVYASLVNLITEKMQLESWLGFSDSAIRGFVSSRWTHGADEVSITVFRTIWPGKHPALEAAIKNLAQRTEEFTKFYLRHATMSLHGESFSPDKFYHRVSGGDFAQHCAAKIFMLWQSICLRLLMNLTHALNEYADAVRATIKSDYFYVSGKFVVFDWMGVTNQMDGVTYLPDVYYEIGEGKARYERWMNLLHENKAEAIFAEWELTQNKEAK